MAAALGMLIGPAAYPATLALNKSFVQKIMNSATVAANLEVDAYSRSPHPISSGGNDGDLSIAGRAAEIGLPVVVKIANAAREKEALALLRTSTPAHPLAVTGAWRFWFERPGSAPQVQGAPVDFPATDNPNHVFEIHPVTRFGSVNLEHWGEPIPGYTAAPAKVAFASYENLSAAISATRTAIIIDSVMAGYNYTEFILELAGSPQDVGDGLIALAHVIDPGDQGPVSIAPRRMVFVKGSEPARRVGTLRRGDRLRVLGIPRINLNEIFAIAQKIGAMRTRVKLPYEMIVMAILPE